MDNLTQRGMGRCRLCTKSPSNVDHDGIGDGLRLVICGAWAHYMLEHNVTLQPTLRAQVLAINPATFRGTTLAYRGGKSDEERDADPTRSSSHYVQTLRIFFFETNDRIHVVGSAPDMPLFNHIRELVLKCGGEVPTALTEWKISAAATGVEISPKIQALVEELQQPLKSEKNKAEWRPKAQRACKVLHAALSGIELGRRDVDRMTTLNEIVQAALMEADLSTNIFRVHGFSDHPNHPEVLAEETLGVYPSAAINVYVCTDGYSIGIYYESVSPHGNLRQVGME